ncbi:MAG: TolC family protein [Candidatus Eremiobacteraeota bacterium]|nr:TolC family protein [Candidatus Eremiobacteraeota bacterium]
MPLRLCVTLAVAGVLLASAWAAPSSVSAQGGTATALPLYTPIPLSSPTPGPSVIPTLPPASSALQIPYPAIGTPAPNVTAGHVDPNVPATITLPQAILIAAARSPLLASARADVLIARGNVTLATVPILPNIAVVGSSVRSHRQSGAGGAGASASATPAPSASSSSFVSSIANDVTSNSLTAELRQLIFDGGRTFAAIKSANASENASVATYQRQLQQVTFNVASAYYNALLAMRTAAVDNDLVTQNVVQANLVIAQLRAGQASRVDVATALLPVSQAQLALVQQQGTLVSTQAALANAMGLDADTVVRPADDTANYQAVVASALPIPTYNQAIARANMLRPDLQSALDSLQAAQYTLKSARAGYLPTVSGSADYGTSSTDANGATFRNSWSIGATLNIPVFDAGQTRGQVQVAQGNVAKAQAFYDTQRLAVQLDVKQTLAALISARSGLDATQVEYDQANTVLRATQAQYRAGVTTLPLLLNAQVQLSKALTDEVNAIYNLRIAEQNFLFAIGQNS